MWKQEKDVLAGSLEFRSSEWVDGCYLPPCLGTTSPQFI